VDERLPARALEGADADPQARRKLVDDLVGGAREHPAQRRHHQLVKRGPGGEQGRR
jgi:hypothetical protein